jgi:hypothetical protein
MGLARERPEFVHVARALFVSGLVALGCAPQVTSIGEWSPGPERFDFEAEAGELSPEFSVQADAKASGAAYIAPPEASADEMPGAARAVYEFTTASAATFVIWGRIRSPGAENNRFWFRVDEGTWYKWRISVGDIWYWDDFHDDTEYGAPLRFELAVGQHQLMIANAVAGAALDRLYITAAGDTPAGNTTSCMPPHSIELRGVCFPSCGSQSGTTCGVTACSGKTILDAYDCDVCCRNPE